jgi:LysM repeat protein
MRRGIETFFTIALVAIVLVFYLAGGGYVYYTMYIKDDLVAVAGPEPPRPKAYQVMPGDSLWAIATRYYPGYHTGEMVHEIRELNQMVSATIYPYEVIKLPEVEL